MLNQIPCLKEHLSTLEINGEEERQRRKDVFASRPANDEVISDQEMVDKIFGFLPSMIGGQEGQAPLGFEVWSCRVVMVHVHSLCKSISFLGISSVVNSV